MFQSTATSLRAGARDTKKFLIAGGTTKTITVRAPGIYAFHCNIHNYMTGVITATG